MCSLFVVKYGGSVLCDGSGIREAAQQVKTEIEKGNRVVVVVSALKGVTDQLLEATESINQNTPRFVQDHIIRLGEEQSTRLFTSALELMGVPSEEFTVDSPGWPIITDDVFGNAEPLLGECRRAVSLSLKPLLERGITPVVCGFVGRSLNGMVTTLGRGGTDTTATVLSRCLGADELVLVKDVGGVFSADPNLVPASEKLDELSIKDAYHLSSGGAKVIHDKVFRHKNPELNIRIISKGEGLSETGTVLNGEILELDILVSDEAIHEVSLVGEDASKSHVVKDTVDRLASIGGIIHSFEACENSLCVCFTHDALIALKSLHELVPRYGLKAISLKENLRLVTLQGRNIDQVKARIPELLLDQRVHRIYADSAKVTLAVEQAFVEEVSSLF